MYLSFGSSKLVKLLEDYRTTLDISFVFELIILYITFENYEIVKY